MEEIWRNIEDYPNYQVSSLGRVKSKERYARTHIHNKDGMRKVKEIILKPTQNRRGYLRITLFNKNGRRQCFVHRLVAQAFINNAKNLPAINHKDENKLNNCVDNLEWCTYGHNEKEAYRLGLKQSRIKPKQVIQLTKDYEIENIFDSLQQIEKTLGFSSGNIAQVCNKKRISAYGYIWRYIDE